MSEHRFKLDDQWYVEAPDLGDDINGCAGCVFDDMDSKYCTNAPGCDGNERADRKFVIFIKEPAE